MLQCDALFLEVTALGRRQIAIEYLWPFMKITATVAHRRWSYCMGLFLHAELVAAVRESEVHHGRTKQ